MGTFFKFYNILFNMFYHFPELVFNINHTFQNYLQFCQNQLKLTYWNTDKNTFSSVCTNFHFAPEPQVTLGFVDGLHTPLTIKEWMDLGQAQLSILRIPVDTLVTGVWANIWSKQGKGVKKCWVTLIQDRQSALQPANINRKLGLGVVWSFFNCHKGHLHVHVHDMYTHIA